MKLRSLFAMLTTAGAVWAAEAPMIAPKEAAKLVAEGKAVLVDVREANEWAETGVAQPAVLLPKSDFDAEQKLWGDFLKHVGDKQVIVYCRSGRRSGIVAEALAAKGVKIANAGGFSEWTAAGLPVRKVETPAAAPAAPAIPTTPATPTAQRAPAGKK